MNRSGNNKSEWRAHSKFKIVVPEWRSQSEMLLPLYIWPFLAKHEQATWRNKDLSIILCYACTAFWTYLRLTTMAAFSNILSALGQLSVKIVLLKRQISHIYRYLRFFNVLRVVHKLFGFSFDSHCSMLYFEVKCLLFWKPINIALIYHTKGKMHYT